MFFNRVYFTTRQTYRRLKNQNAGNRKLTTFDIPGGGGNDPNGGGNGPNGGQGGPNFDYIVTVFVLGSGFYFLNKKN
uniref:Uncharacterized protein n=1 Tax=viral metagenome TaxID=1070528 RepID=A0A6C0L764_9ZZZZ